jgi:hypothetical protein
MTPAYYYLMKFLNCKLSLGIKPLSGVLEKAEALKSGHHVPHLERS